MQQTWQGTLKEDIINQYVQNSQEWVEVNISTSGLLNLTIVSDRFVGLSIPQRKDQILSFLHQSQVRHLSPGFLFLYTHGIVDYFYERSYLPDGVAPSISVTQIFGEVRIPNATGRVFVVPAGSLDLD